MSKRVYPSSVLSWDDNSDTCDTYGNLVVSVAEVFKERADSKPSILRKAELPVKEIPGLSLNAKRTPFELRTFAYGLRQRAQDANSAVTSGKFDSAENFFTLFKQGKWSPEAKERAPRLTKELLLFCRITARCFKAPLEQIQAEVLGLSVEQRQAIEQREDWQAAKAEIEKEQAPVATGILAGILAESK